MTVSQDELLGGIILTDEMTMPPKVVRLPVKKEVA